MYRFSLNTKYIETKVEVKLTMVKFRIEVHGVKSISTGK